MKKSTDTIIRIFFIVAIFGAIGNYYYQKYRKPVAPVLKSNIILIPKPATDTTDKIPKQTVTNQTRQKQDNISEKRKTALNTHRTNKTENVKRAKETPSAKTYKIIIPDIPEKSKILRSIEDYVKSVSAKIKLTKSVSTENIIFTRVLIGPFKNKMEMIKASGKINDLKIDSIRLNIKGSYYIQVASFSNKKKLNDFVKFLHKKRISNIVFLKVKIPRKTVHLTVDNIDEPAYKKITDFLKNQNQIFKTAE